MLVSTASFIGGMGALPSTPSLTPGERTSPPLLKANCSIQGYLREATFVADRSFGLIRI
jgi:hypothetical protein